MVGKEAKTQLSTVTYKVLGLANIDSQRCLKVEPQQTPLTYCCCTGRQDANRLDLDPRPILGILLFIDGMHNLPTTPLRFDATLLSRSTLPICQ